MPNLFSKLYFVEPSPAARRLLWHVLSIGSVSLDESDHHRGFDKPGAHLFWVVSGKGVMELEEKSYSLEPGPCCWLVDLRKPRTYIPAPGGRLTTAGFRFGGVGLEAWQEMLADDQVYRLGGAKDAALIRQAQRQLLRLVTRRPASFEWRAHEIITGVLGTLLKARNLFSSAQAQAPLPVTRVVNAILANPARDWKARELAVVAQVSYSGLRRLFKATQQESLHQFIQRTRLDQARMLLSDRGFSIKEIAEQLNFSSEFYFSHFFRKAAGISPTEFRRVLAGETIKNEQNSRKRPLRPA